MKNNPRNFLKENLDLVITVSIIFLCLIAYLIYDTYRVNKSIAERYTEFYETNMNGRIHNLSGSGGKYFFNLSIDEKERYFFTPRQIDNETPSFHLEVDNGDYIIKPAYSDTITIVSDGRTYKYLFKDFTK